MAKQLMFDDEGRRKVLAGLQKLSATVKVTLGPSGRNVILDRTMGSPSATTDGVSIAKEIELEDPFENVGARLANSVADKTNDEVGDGSSTSVVLTEALGVPDPAAYWSAELLPATYEEFHAWHRRIGMERSPLDHVGCC